VAVEVCLSAAPGAFQRLAGEEDHVERAGLTPNPFEE
jgi:hypothetical protein